MGDVQVYVDAENSEATVPGKPLGGVLCEPPGRFPAQVDKVATDLDPPNSEVLDQLLLIRRLILLPTESGLNLVGRQVELLPVHDEAHCASVLSSTVLVELQRVLAGNGRIPTEQQTLAIIRCHVRVRTKDLVHHTVDPCVGLKQISWGVAWLVKRSQRP